MIISVNTHHLRSELYAHMIGEKMTIFIYTYVEIFLASLFVPHFLCHTLPAIFKILTSLFLKKIRVLSDVLPRRSVNINLTSLN